MAPQDEIVFPPWSLSKTKQPATSDSDRIPNSGGRSAFSYRVIRQIGVHNVPGRTHLDWL